MFMSLIAINEKITNEILCPAVAIQERFLNRRTIKEHIPPQIHVQILKRLKGYHK